MRINYIYIYIYIYVCIDVLVYYIDTWLASVNPKQVAIGYHPIYNTLGYYSNNRVL